MKHAWLYIIGLMFLGMITFNGGTASATSKNGAYYAIPSWDQTLPASSRFVVLTNMNNEAVLDLETGLVWEQSPSTGTDSWNVAENHCINLTKGGRDGWRLPTIQELKSLVDGTQSNPALSSGNPFTNVRSDLKYGSSTTWDSNNAYVWRVDFSNGSADTGPKAFLADSDALYAWCVRSAQGVNPQ